VNIPSARLLPYAVADGPHNMAADEVLLEAAAGGVASLRFYGWSEATLSLGYFQPERRRLDDERLAGLPFVRRPTGGDALVHHHELTYALALPAGPPWQRLRSCNPCMHRIIAAALARFGITAHLYDPECPAPFAGVLCFQHVTAGDLLIGAHKVAGSAQRKQRRALLQHGGILLARSPHAPALPGIRELAGRELSAGELDTAIAGEFSRETGWQLVPDEWTEQERQRVEVLAANKYGRDAWNRKR
jgi:lipoate-protein ligase A